MPTPFKLPTYTAQVTPGADPVTSLRPPAIVQGSSTNPHAFAQADAMQALKQAFAPRPYMPWFAQQAPAADWSKTYNTGAWMPPWVMNPGTVSTGGTNLGLGGMFGYTGNYGASPGPGVDNGTWGGVPRPNPINPQQPNWITSAPPASTGPRVPTTVPLIDGQPGVDPWAGVPITPRDKVPIINGQKPGGTGGAGTGGTGGTGVNVFGGYPGYPVIPDAPTELMDPALTSTGGIDYFTNFKNLFSTHPQLANEYRTRDGNTINWWQTEGQNQVLQNLFGGDQNAMNAWINGTSAQGGAQGPTPDAWLSQLNNLGGVQPPAWALEAYRQARAAGQPINPMYEPFL